MWAIWRRWKTIRLEAISNTLQHTAVATRYEVTPRRSRGRVQLKCDGTRWRKGEEVKGKLVNGVGNQYSSHYLGTWCIQHYYRWCAHLGCQQSIKLTPPADLNGLVRFAERRNLVSARVPSHFKRSLHKLSKITWRGNLAGPDIHACYRERSG
jgi:hypothetical protein